LGSLTVTDSAANSPQILQLTGAGVDFALAPDGNTSLTISSGQNAVFPLLLSSAANVTGTAAIVCTGMPANSTCNVNPASVALGGTATVSVTVLTGVASTSSSQKSPLNTYRVLFLTSLMPLSLLPLRRHRLRRLTCGVVLCMLLAASGCGAGRTIPVQGGTSSTSPLPSGPATPAGTYTIVASATSAGLTRTVNLTLIVR
jgi:hypothetical protein